MVFRTGVSGQATCTSEKRGDGSKHLRKVRERDSSWGKDSPAEETPERSQGQGVPRVLLSSTKRPGRRLEQSEEGNREERGRGP